MKKNIFMFLTILLLLLTLLLLFGCNHAPKENHITVERYSETGINFTTIPIELDFEHIFQLDHSKKEEIIIQDIFDGLILYTKIYFNSHTEQYKTAYLGVFCLESQDIKYMHHTMPHVYVYGAIFDSEKNIIYAETDGPGTGWRVIKIANGETVNIDEGYSTFNQPMLTRLNDNAIYVYEKVIDTSGSEYYENKSNSYEYGVNLIDNTKLIPLLKKNFGTDYQTELLLSRLMGTNNNHYSLFVEREKKAAVDIFSADEEAGSIVLDDKFYWMALLEDHLFLSLQDRATDKPKVMIVSFDGIESITKTNENSPYYRLESDGKQHLMAVDMSFGVYIISFYGDQLRREKVELENHSKQPVGFYNIEEKKFLLHFYGGGQPDQLYILEIVDGDL